jgi:Bifunctional DNA primase/polymerase, N-terminal
VVGIDIDTDNPDIRRAIVSSIPASTFRKRGNKGETVFCKGTGIASKSFNVGKVRVLDVLSDGRFYVLPSSVHPDSGRPYVWTGPDSFADYSPVDLPDITVEHVAAIGEALRPFGWQAPAERAARPAQGYNGSGGGDIWKVLNDKAIANLDAWVPHLGLYSLRRTREGYQAVATWRPSSTGQPIERRKRNLGISTRGIRDFGDDRGYSPIDLVMEARGLDFDKAFAWLEQLVDPSDIVINLKPKLLARVTGATAP